MKKWLRVLLIVLLVSGTSGLAWLAMHTSREPVYQGKRLSVWLHGYDNLGSTGIQQRREAAKAVENMGTDVIPFLLQRLRQNDSSLKNKVMQLLAKQHLVKIPYTPARVLNIEAMEAFNTLGTRASNAVPELIQIYSRNISQDSQWTVAFSLGDIGPAASNAVPLLLEHASANQTTNSPNEFMQPVHSSSIRALGHIHAQPAKVVPVLIVLLGRNNISIQNSAALALGEFGSDAKPAIPLLIKFYNNLNDNMSKEVIGAAIKKIDFEAAAKAGIQ